MTSKTETADVVRTFDVEEIHIPNNCIVWAFRGTDHNFSFNPYSGAVTFKAETLNWVFVLGKAHSIECARKLVHFVCARDEVTGWIAPTDAQLDRGDQGRYETLFTPTWSKESSYGIRHGQMLDDRHFCKCGICPMPESFRWTDYPCSVWCTAYYLA